MWILLFSIFFQCDVLAVNMLLALYYIWLTLCTVSSVYVYHCSNSISVTSAMFWSVRLIFNCTVQPHWVCTDSWRFQIQTHAVSFYCHYYCLKNKFSQLNKPKLLNRGYFCSLCIVMHCDYNTVITTLVGVMLACEENNSKHYLKSHQTMPQPNLWNPGRNVQPFFAPDCYC